MYVYLISKKRIKLKKKVETTKLKFDCMLKMHIYFYSVIRKKKHEKLLVWKRFIRKIKKR